MGWLDSSLADDHHLLQQQGRHAHCFAGQHWEWDGVSFDILHPTPESYAQQPSGADDNTNRYDHKDNERSSCTENHQPLWQPVIAC